MIRSFGLRPRKSSSLGMTACSVKLEEAPTRRTPRNSPVPRAARSASSSAARIASTRPRYSAPASVNDSARVLRVKSAAPISFSRVATMREADGCESPSSRAAREKLPARATRTKSRRATMRSVMNRRFIHQTNVCYSCQASTGRGGSGAHWQCSRNTAPTDRRDPMTLPERLAAFRANFEAGGPPQAHTFETYRDKYENLRMKRKNGILEVALHTRGGPLVFNGYVHQALVHAFRDIGDDPDNHVVILTGTGNEFCAQISPEGFDFFTPTGYDKV